jgi:hypothetical protein
MGPPVNHGALSVPLRRPAHGTIERVFTVLSDQTGKSL